MATICINGSCVNIDPSSFQDQQPMTPEQKAEIDRIHKNLDDKLTTIYQNKLIALGYPSSWEDAEVVYKSAEKQIQIDSEYRQLEFRKTLDEMIGSLELTQRNLNSKEL